MQGVTQNRRRNALELLSKGEVVAWSDVMLEGRSGGCRAMELEVGVHRSDDPKVPKNDLSDGSQSDVAEHGAGAAAADNAVRWEEAAKHDGSRNDWMIQLRQCDDEQRDLGWIRLSGRTKILAMVTENREMHTRMSSHEEVWLLSLLL